MKPSFGDIEKLYKELIIPFYDLERDLAVRTKKRRTENDAEHSWSLALLACSLAAEVDPDLDIGKVSMFAIVHDLVEIHAGDTSVWSAKEILDSKHDREEKALAKIKKEFVSFPWLGKIISEYESKKSPEAQYVWALDKFINLLIIYLDQNQYNVDKYHSTKKMFDDLIASHRTKAHAHKAVGEYYDHMLALFDAHPEYFVKDKNHD